MSPLRTPLAALALLFALAAPARAQFGVAAGINLDRFGDIESTPRATIDNATGYHVGLFLDLPLGPLSVRPGVYFVDAGEVSFDVDGVFCGLPEGCPDGFDLTLIQVPIDLRLRVGTPFVKPYALAGPVLRFADSEDEPFRESLKEFAVAGSAGVGIELSPPGFGLRFYPELRYTFGIDSLVDDYEFLGATFESEDDLTLSSWVLRLGVAF